MEDEEGDIENYGEEEGEEVDDRYIIYEHGYPFYKLKKRESSPHMNLYKTFSLTNPGVTEFFKDVEKNKWSQQYVDAFILVLTDVKLFAETNNMTSCKTAALYEIFYSCFEYFFLLPALEKDQYLKYFRETLLQYAVFDPPERLRVFNATECFSIAKLFHELVANNFEMMKYVLVPVYRIQLQIE